MMFAPGPLGVWTLGSAAMLAWGAAAAIPIILHLWNRRRYQEVSWGAMDFLLAAIRKDSARLTLEQMILLLCRIAALVVFALAVADLRTTWGSRQPLDPAPIQTHYLLVLDTSFSMDYRARDRSRLELARAAATSLIDHSAAGDGYSVLLMENPPQPLATDFSTDRQAIHQLLDEITTSQGGADLTATLSAIDQIVEAARRRATTHARIQVVFLSDMGGTTWNEADSSACRSLFQRIAEKADISLIDVDESDAGNVAVMRLTSNRPFVIVGERVTIEAELRSFRARENLPVTLEFLVDGRSVDSQAVTIPQGGRVTVSTTQQFDAPGDRVIEAKLSVDGLVVDNQRWWVLPVRSSLRVLCIEGEPEAGEFVAAALNPTGTVESPFRVETAFEGALLDRSLEQYDCLVVNNVARFGPRDSALLRQYVERGGGLIVALGDRVQPDHYNQLFAGNNREGNFFPARLGQLVREGEHFFDPLGYRHPLVVPFKGYDRAGLLTVPTWRYFRLSPLSRSAEIPLAFRNGDPAVVVGKLGRGKTIAVATALSTSSVDQTAQGVVPWTALPAWPSFPPLVHALVREAAVGREPPAEVQVGTPFEVVLPGSVDETIEIALPDGSSQRVSLNHEDGLPRASFAETNQRGVYRITSHTASGIELVRKFAVNVDPLEGDLEKTPIDNLPVEVGLFDDPASGEVVIPAIKARPWFRELLAGLVVMLLVESLLAGWFSRSGR